MLLTNFWRKSVMIPMPCQAPSESDSICCEQNNNGTQRVLWIGRICKVKRPDRLLDIAEACPDLNFDLVGPAADTEYVHGIQQRAKTIVNVTLHGPASRDCISKFYKNARIMCCTSDFEGFPNTFLEAWSYGLPIVSTVDPDNLIAEKGLGKVGKDIRELADNIHELLDSPNQYRNASQSAQEYFLKNHSIDNAMKRFERVFCDVVNSADDKGEGDII